MGYVSEIVQSGVALADRAQVGQYVEKARGYERIDALIDLASQRAPDVVKQLDEKVDQVLGGVSDRKAKALEHYNGAVEFVQQKKGDAQERYNGAKELLEQKKDDALAHVSGAKDLLEQKKGDVLAHVSGAKDLLEQKKDDALARVSGAKDVACQQLEQTKGDVLAQVNGAKDLLEQKKDDVLERVQKSKDEMVEFVQEKKGSVLSLAQDHLPKAAQERLSQVQVGLLMSVLVAQYHSVLDLPRSVKQRIEKGLPELQQQYSASFETAKSWMTERFEQLPQATTSLKGQGTKLRELAEVQYAAAKLLALATAESLQSQLPSLEAAKSSAKGQATKLRELAQVQYAALREQAAAAAQDATAWVKTRIPSKQD